MKQSLTSLGFLTAGKDLNRLLQSLDKAASAQRFSTVWRAHDSRMICLSPQHAAGSKVNLSAMLNLTIVASPPLKAALRGGPTNKISRDS